MKLLLKTRVTLMGDNWEQYYPELFVLEGTTPRDRDVPKGAGFRWNPLLGAWWTDSEENARKLAHLAVNGLAARWNGQGVQPATAPTGPYRQSALYETETTVVGTPQQDSFWTAVVDGDSHIVLMARAGTGKTFSVIEAAKRALRNNPRLRVGFSAFNSHIAKELKEKVPHGCKAFTLHSLGLAAITASLGRRPTIDDGKVRALLDQIAGMDDRNKGKVDRALAKAVCALVSFCKFYIYEGTAEQLDELVARHNVDLNPDNGKAKSRSVFTEETLKPRVYELVPRLLDACQRNLSMIDYDDMIWLPVVMGYAVESFDLLFVDEAQDMNVCQRQLAFLACPSGRIVIVGDPAQSIYAFTGADTRSMPNMTALLKATARGVQILPLTFTRRCPKSHVALAQTLVPDIQAMPEAPEGIVETINEKQFSQSAQAGDMVLCRVNAPLVGAAHQFLRAGKKAVLRGKDLSGQIRDMIEGFGAQTIEELDDMLMRYRLAEGERLENAGKSAQVITAHEDRCDTLSVLMEGCGSLRELDSKISRIFDSKDEAGAIILSSVHGSKGLEADKIYLLKPDLMPHPKAERDEDLEQERNIKYVALTRSKNHLVFVQDDRVRVSSGGSDSPGPEATGMFGLSEEDGDDPFWDGDPEELEDDTVHELVASESVADPVQERLDDILSPRVDWRENARQQLRALHDSAPFDAPDEYLDYLERAMGAIPRGS